MRLILLILVGVLCASCASQPPTVPATPAPSTQPNNQKRSSISVRIWTTAGDTATEEQFDVDLNAKQVVSNSSKPIPEGTKLGWATANIYERARSRAVYDRMVEKAKASKSPKVDDELANELRRIDDRRRAGYVPEDFVVASPDGTQAVIRSEYRPLFLVDVATLMLRSLLKDAGNQTPPVAWSLDSRSLAFAPAISGELHVYDVQLQTTSVVTRAAPQWIKELSWSPDGAQIGALGLTNRRMDKNPLALIAAGAGHPIFRNDAVLFVYNPDGDGRFAVPLKRGISESSTPRARIEWK